MAAASGWRAPAAPLLLALALALAGCASSSSTTTSTASGSATTESAPSTPQRQAQTGPERFALEQGAPLAPASSTASGATVDGIQCAPIEQLAYHIHAHLQVFVAGQPRALPGGIGLIDPAAQQTAYGPFYGATKCYYWLHTHASDGIVHIESPTQRIYTLGNFFDEWGQRLSASRVASAVGAVTAFIDGKRWAKDPRALPLGPHAVIQLDVGAPVVPFAAVSFAGKGL